MFGSGAGVVVLRRLADALTDHDHIYAVIRGSAVNNDGASKVSYLAPSVDGQAAAIAEALAIAEVDPASVSFVEAHGTGTAVGDPIEVAALTQAYGSTGETCRCALGSIKSNIGHLDTAAGVISLAKAALALEHEVIPPTVHYREPNPSIDFDAGPFYVNPEPLAWPRGQLPRRAGVSSLGVGGTNAHVILEEAPVESRPPASAGSHLLCLSARTAGSLESASSRLAGYLEERDQVRLSDVAFTLSMRRQFRERRVVLCSSAAEASEVLRASDDRRRAVGASASAERNVAFMFAGGGAQYPGMGHELYETERVYRESVDECLDLLDPESRRALWTVLNGDRLSVELASQMERPSIGLPALLTCQVSMARLAASWGLNPTAMIGHSMGEYTAAQLAGVFSLRDALRLVQLRGQLFETVPKDGMLSVPLSPDELRDLLGSDLSIAAENAPQLCVASGPVEALRSLERKLEQQDIQCTRVRINIAAHSSMLDGILEEFRQFVASITLAPPTIPFVSNLTGDWIRDSEATDPEYWVRHLRNTVQFSAGVRLLTGDSTLALMEIGPGRTLATLARLNAPISQRSVAVTSMASADDASAGDRHAALLGMGELWCNGVRVDWTSLRSGDEPRRVPVPTYSFERSRHWIDAPVQSGEASTVEDESRRPVDEWFYVSEWERTIGPPAAESAGARLSVVLDDRSELGLALAEELRSKGDSVAFVRRAESFTQSEALDFTVNPLSSDDYVRLVESVLALAKGATVRFLYLWSGGASAGTQAEAEEQSFYSLVRLAQAWGREGSDANAELCLLSAGLWKIGGESAGDPSQALALGPMRVIPSEFSNLRTRAIDVGLPRASETTSHRLARQVSTELDRPDGGDIALRGGERWRRVFRRIALTDRTSGHESVGPIKHQGVYLITGGFGGIGALLAERLASQCAAKLILVGRHADGPVVDAIVSRCTALGSELLPLAEDIAETEGAGRVVNEARRRFGHIDGVFHAAGVLDDGLMQLRTDEQSAAVLAPKVRGTIALDQALGDGDDGLLFVLFSSISAEAGLLGQADYAAASTFLDSYATARRESKAGLSVSVQWGTWVDVGMAARIANPGTPSAGGPVRTHTFGTHRRTAHGRSRGRARPGWARVGWRVRCRRSSGSYRSRTSRGLRYV